MRCLEPAALDLEVEAREIDQSGTEDEELRSPYVERRRARHRPLGPRRDHPRPAHPLLCRPDCLGLCPVCGVSLNDADPADHEHEHRQGPPLGGPGQTSSWSRGRTHSPAGTLASGCPAGNAMGTMADFRWQEERLAVQIDGPDRPPRKPDEALADLVLQNAGYRVLHFTVHEAAEKPDWVADLLQGFATRFARRRFKAWRSTSGRATSRPGASSSTGSSASASAIACQSLK